MQNYSTEKIQIGDKEVTRYEASQLMRQIETQMRYKKDEIIINSYYDNVNTNIAFQDNFRSLKNIKTDNNLIIVDKGTTKLRIVYSYFKTGLIVTVIGIILEIVVLILFIKDNTNDECEEKF